MLTNNQLKKKLVSWFENHAQVKTLKYESDFDFTEEAELSYPVCNIQYISSAIANNVTNHTYKIVLGDLSDDNVDGIVDEIYNDMLLIAEDFFAYLQYSEEGFIFNKSSNLQPFFNEGADRVAGIVFQIQLGTIRSQNDCQTPTIA